MTSLIKNEKGSAVIFELAFLLPVMIMIFYGYTMFTNALAIDLALKTAAREGAREYAITRDAGSGMSKASQELTSAKVFNANISSFEMGEGRGIKVSKIYGFNIPFIGYYGPELTGYGIFIEEPPR